MSETPPPGLGAQRVVLVRHGETAWSRADRHTGRSDVPLDPEGAEQAERLRGWLRQWTFAEVLCSPLQRARRTCEIAGYAAVARPDREMEEWDYGAYEGLTSAQIRADHPGWTIWKDGVAGGETVADVGRRADSVIGRVREVSGDVALFAHGHFLRILAARWCELPVLVAERLAFSPAAVSVLGYDRGDPVICLWNETCHLTDVSLAP